MNVRFAAGEMRVRVTREELQTLRAGRTLVLHVSLPGLHGFHASVTADRLRGWQLDSDPTGLWLTLPPRELEEFAAGAPTVAALTHRFELDAGSALVARFEVDVRS